MRRVSGASLVEFAVATPLLLALVLGGSSLFLRIMYRNSLDVAAEQAAWSAARTGGDESAVLAAVLRAVPFVPPGTITVTASSSGYHAEVRVEVAYTGDAVTTLPLFNEPLPPGRASATNQQERAFALDLCGDDTPKAASSPAPADARYGAASVPAELGGGTP